jgi:TRAP-type C4-dicarboxylate transport system substrate-binding protein
VGPAAGYPPTNYHSQNLQTFADEVKAATGGKLEITVHPGASLFKVPEIKRAVQSGQAQIGELLMSLLENEDALFGIDAVPFLATSFDDSCGCGRRRRPFIDRKMQAQGMTVLYVVPWPPQGLYAKKDINSLADMKGLKFRAYSPATSRIAQLVGAQAVTIQAAELPQALATGVVNSFISSGSTGYDSKVWESLTHWYDTQAWLPKNMIFVNNAAWAKLDKPTQDAVIAAAAKAETRGLGIARSSDLLHEGARREGHEDPAALADLKRGFEEIGAKLTEDWLAKAGADGKAAVEAYKKTM